MVDIGFVIAKYYSGHGFYIDNNDYETLKWYEDNTFPKPTLEEIEEKWNEYVAALPLEELRKERDDLLVKTDKYALPDWPHASLAKQTEWLEYRQALRDLPANTEDPANPVWPVQPSP